MLAGLTVKNIATIEKIEWDLKSGFSALTGETGAGKSILIDSVQMLLGEKTSKDVIRSGAPAASVEGVFTDIPENAAAFLRENGVEPEEDGTLIITRELSAEGRSVCRVNGRAVPLSTVRALGRMLVNMHGQHENQLLLNEQNHLAFLDSYADVSKELSRYQTVYKELLELRREIKTLTENADEKKRRAEYLRASAEELRAAAVAAGEEKKLLDSKKEAANAEAINGAVDESYKALFSSEGSVCDKLYEVKTRLSDAGRLKPSLSALSERIDAVLSEAKDVASELNNSLTGGDAVSLDAIEERLEVIHRLKIKYGVRDADELSLLTEKYSAEADAIDQSDKTAEELKERYREKYKALEAAAETLSEKRKKKAAALDKSIVEELTYLDMKNVRFITEMTENEKNGKRVYNENGDKTVRFLISANVGEEPRPLAKIASGGEISRLMLAVKAVMADKLPVPTLIFDEIDTGVSGKTASKIGAKMKEIAKDSQVICVTHLAQIAAKADNQYKIAKRTENGRSFSELSELAGEKRIDELARIIGGEKITDAARETARELTES